MYRVIAERRDMRRFVPGSKVSDEVLARLLQAAHAAPNVGLMQPWRFIRITDDAYDGVSTPSSTRSACRPHTRWANGRRSFSL